VKPARYATVPISNGAFCYSNRERSGVAAHDVQLRVAVVFGWPKKFFSEQFRVSLGSVEAFLAATALVVTATLVRWGLGFLGETLLPFTTYYPVVLFATYLGGLRVGIFTTIAGGLVGWWAFLSPHVGLSSLGITGQLELLTYAVACALIMWGADSYRRLAERLRDEEKLRTLAVDELAHRLKNKIASIQSIISYQLREQPQLRDDIIARLIALAATDDLIMTAQGRGASLRAILSTELKPYGLARIAMDGPDIILTPTLALTIALVVHELATNAAKYGALSRSVGKLSIKWTLVDRILNLRWRETDGPLVASPTHRGFGSRLLSRALEQFSGAVETTFEPDGLICTMKAVLPDNTPGIVTEAKTASVEAAE
jgi:two-component sensor histidine kinase